MRTPLTQNKLFELDDKIEELQERLGAAIDVHGPSFDGKLKELREQAKEILDDVDFCIEDNNK